MELVSIFVNPSVPANESMPGTSGVVVSPLVGKRPDGRRPFLTILKPWVTPPKVAVLARESTPFVRSGVDPVKAPVSATEPISMFVNPSAPARESTLATSGVVASPFVGRSPEGRRPLLKLFASWVTPGIAPLSSPGAREPGAATSSPNAGKSPFLTLFRPSVAPVKDSVSVNPSVLVRPSTAVKSGVLTSPVVGNVGRRPFLTMLRPSVVPVRASVFPNESTADKSGVAMSPSVGKDGRSAGAALAEWRSKVLTDRTVPSERILEK
ncbi:hypothetical protein JOL62DRAFT_579382 [Phyllosticta paracitricarpa]|uniref:Uncharacterized protein n=1 Tax=Phyllosticta paracitricarpa TaxID=2016321 RepID=A0ABR1N1E8_9PEZI